MALALTVTPNNTVVGRPVVVTGTGFTASGSVDLEVVGVGSSVADVMPRLTASGGAITTVGKAVIVPRSAGLLRITAKDITAGTKITKTLRVSGGGA